MMERSLKRPPKANINDRKMTTKTETTPSDCGGGGSNKRLPTAAPAAITTTTTAALPSAPKSLTTDGIRPNNPPIGNLECLPLSHGGRYRVDIDLG